MKLVRRVFKGAAVSLLLGVIGIAGLTGAIWLEHATAVTLPMPTGPFRVSRLLQAWTDQTAVDSLAPVLGTKRELVVWIWYPAAPGQAATEEYLPAGWRSAFEQLRGPVISNFLTRDLSKVRGHSLRNGDVSAQERAYPVVIFRAGASAAVANYTTLAEDLASHGYVVVGLDAPYRTDVVVFADDRVIRRTPENNPERCLGREATCADRLIAAWNADIAFVLDRLGRLNAADETGKFTGRLDLTRVGLLGHSFGGATALQFCHDDSRCTAGIDLDGAPLGSVVAEGVHQPFLFLLSDHSRENDAESQKIRANIQSIYDRLPADGRQRLAIRGAHHFTFSDDGALLKSHLLRGVLRMFGKLHIDGPRQLAVTTYCVRTFFDAYLKGASGSRFRIVSSSYPEIEILD